MTAWPEPFSFGALPLPDGRTRFRLWAPSAPPGLALLIEGRDPIALRRDAQGYAQVDVDCGPGTRYRYRIGDALVVPDPASRLQAGDVRDGSVGTGLDTYPWRHPGWRGRPWEETVLYEVHVGLAGGYAGLRQRLPTKRPAQGAVAKAWGWAWAGRASAAPPTRYRCVSSRCEWATSRSTTRPWAPSLRPTR